MNFFRVTAANRKRVAEKTSARKFRKPIGKVASEVFANFGGFFIFCALDGAFPLSRFSAFLLFQLPPQKAKRHSEQSEESLLQSFHVGDHVFNLVVVNH